ncbi:MAG: nuclear transport factor 2 family protein [Brumimicrobium sp.]|nr:nuclear transport factor 2 family protein [Brumimicrobium sp.]
MESERLIKRSAREVFEDHLKLAKNGELEKDLIRNCAEDIVLLTNYGTFYGFEGVREATELLNNQLPDGIYEYKLKMNHGEMCFLHWKGDSHQSRIEDGADSFLIREGKIQVQTIYYTVNTKN